MDIKSLMVGDWVQLKTYGVSDKFEKTEAYIFVKVAEIGSGLITVEYNNDIKEPYRICENTEIEPIPLIPEILEKNGFKLDKEDGWWWLTPKIGITFWEEGDIELEFENKHSSVDIHIKYLHQLQQALRLCNVSKEIEL